MNYDIAQIISQERGEYPTHLNVKHLEFDSGAYNVGDAIPVLSGWFYGGGEYLSDCCCGDTTIVRIKRNGTIVLANNMQFKKDGKPLSGNRNMIANAYFALPRNADRSLTNEYRSWIV